MPTKYDFYDLKDLLSMVGVESQKEIEQRFSDIAKVLLTKTAIKKGELLYFLTDIEFYWFSKNHKDIITYPRICNAGDWFFHKSGVDIAFQSYVDTDVRKGRRKAILSGKERFGGILVRGIKPSSYWLEDGEFKNFDGPNKTVDELFDCFTALSCPTDFPTLVSCEHELSYHKEARYNLNGNKTPEAKVNSILKENYYDAFDACHDEMIKAYMEYFNAKYRFREDKEPH